MRKYVQNLNFAFRDIDRGIVCACLIIFDYFAVPRRLVLSGVIMAKRIQKEYARVVADTEDMGAYRNVEMDEANVLKWKCLMLPSAAPYNKGAFRLAVDFPETYPFKPPKVTFLTKIYHPNVDAESGNICIAALKDSDWRPTTQMVDVLTALANLIDEPNPSDPVNNDAAEMYINDNKKFMKTAEEWVKKHAEKRPA